MAFNSCRLSFFPPNQTDLVRLDTLMRTVDIHEAKTHLSRLVDLAAKGEAFVIAKAGKPLVKVIPLDTPSARPVRRLGFNERPDHGAQ